MTKLVGRSFFILIVMVLKSHFLKENWFERGGKVCNYVDEAKRVKEAAMVVLGCRSCAHLQTNPHQFYVLSAYIDQSAKWEL